MVAFANFLKPLALKFARGFSASLEKIKAFWNLVKPHQHISNLRIASSQLVLDQL